MHQSKCCLSQSDPIWTEKMKNLCGMCSVTGVNWHLTTGWFSIAPWKMEVLFEYYSCMCMVKLCTWISIRWRSVVRSHLSKLDCIKLHHNYVHLAARLFWHCVLVKTCKMVFNIYILWCKQVGLCETWGKCEKNEPNKSVFLSF